MVIEDSDINFADLAGKPLLITLVGGTPHIYQTEICHVSADPDFLGAARCPDAQREVVVIAVDGIFLSFAA